MTIAISTKKAVRPSKAVKVLTDQTGPVGIAEAAAKIVSGAGMLRDVLAERVSIIGGLVASNEGVSKSSLFDSLMTAIGDQADVPGQSLSVATLYRYATIHGLITGHGLPVSAATVKAAYQLTEGKRGAAMKAVQGASGKAVATPDAFGATVQRAITAADKASAPKAPAADSVGTKRQTLSAWRKSLSEYVESAPAGDREAIRKALTATLATLAPVAAK